MTARWSGAVRGTDGGNARVPRMTSKASDGGFSHGARWRVSKDGVFITGARDAKHRL
jgi:hypothetical protein